MRRGLAIVVVIALAASSSVPVVHASRQSAELTARAFERAYNLDHDEAVSWFQRAIIADPSDGQAHLGMATVVWLHIMFTRGAALVDSYLGRVTRPQVQIEPPPAAQAKAFYEHANRALELAEQQIRANSGDANAHYQLGATVGVMASYSATVEGRVIGAFRSARRAYDAHEQVLHIDPSRKDAGLIVGVYRYVVSTLSLPMRLMAYLVGFGGDRALGLHMVEEAAHYSGDNRTDAQFALVLLYNREERYDAAVGVLRELQQRYPRNRLLWLEEGSTWLRAGKPADAERALETGLAMLLADPRARMFGEQAIWQYKRGAARVALKRYGDAERDLRWVVNAAAHDWVKGRTRIELARIAIVRGDVQNARTHCEIAIRLCDSDDDQLGSASAQRLLERIEQMSKRP